MRKNSVIRYAFPAFCCLIVLALSSCKKNQVSDEDQGNNAGNPSPGVGSRAELSKDSIYLYAKDIYYWNDALPAYSEFNPRKYVSQSSDLSNYEQELFDLTQYKINPTTGKPFEYVTPDPGYPYHPKYSYIEDETTFNSQISAVQSSVDLDGTGYDVGIYAFQGYGSSNSSLYVLYIAAVFPNSPAEKAGLTRGALITKINGRTIGTNFESEVDLMNDVSNGATATVTLSGRKTDGTVFQDLVLNRVKYNSSPVYKTKIFNVGDKKIGYLAYARFSPLTNPDSDNPSDTNLDPVFANFANQGVTDLIIDLRYNGGGFVNSAEYLVNLIAPSTATGKMYTEYYNTPMQSGQAKILAHQPLTDGAGGIVYQDGKMVTYADLSYTAADNTHQFKKAGSLNGITNVVFIVTGGTASASELVINSLKPHMNVKLVGAQTYGKPVGFFPIRIENRYDMYIPNFESKNSLDQGGYYDGFTPDIAETATNGIYDDCTHDFGDSNEIYLSNALNLLAPHLPGSRGAVMSLGGKNIPVSAVKRLPKTESNKFIGMIETRHTIKP